MDIRAYVFFDVSPDNPINDNGTWAFETPDTDRGIAVEAMAFSEFPGRSGGDRRH